jgi:hydroxymethylglutaryl-CoA lyase
MKQKYVIHEVGPRDGLQMEKLVVPPETRLRWIEASAAAGVDIIQVGSFVHPEKVPQMAATDELFRELAKPGRKPNGVVLSGLVLNERGLDRAFDCGVDLICVGVSASETHSRKNTGMGVAEATDRIVAIAKRIVDAGKPVQVSVQSAFGCGFEGEIPKERVLGIVRRYLDEGFRNVSLADTAGHGSPDRVGELFDAILAMDPEVHCACHIHNTYGLGLANVLAAMYAGVEAIETSFAGLGGCPFTKQAGGNVPTEDLVHMLQRMGLRKDLKLDGLISLAREVAELFGREMPGIIYRTGPIGGSAGGKC